MIWNTVTSTDEAGLLYIVRNDPIVQSVPVMLVYRDSVEPGMAPLTLKRFSYACQLLAAGIEWNEDSAACKKVEELPDWYGDDLPVEPNVQIWTKGAVPVFTNAGTMQMSVNVFTELTSVRNFVYIMRLKAEERQAITDILEEHKPVVSEQAAPEHNELDEYFPRDENGQAPTTAPIPPTNFNALSPTDTPHFGDYKLKAADKQVLAQLYGGKVVSFNIGNLVASGGSVEIYSTYGSGLSKYPMTTLSPQSIDYIKEDRTKAFLQSLVENAGSSAKKFRGVFFVNVKGDGKVYLNLNKLDEVDQFPSANTFLPSTEEAAPAQQMMAGTPRDVDIPF